MGSLLLHCAQITGMSTFLVFPLEEILRIHWAVCHSFSFYSSKTFYLLNNKYVSDSILTAFQISHLTFPIILWCRYHYFHIMDNNWSTELGKKNPSEVHSWQGGELGFSMGFSTSKPFIKIKSLMLYLSSDHPWPFRPTPEPNVLIWFNWMAQSPLTNSVFRQHLH